jgi:hypothetical protein
VDSNQAIKAFKKLLQTHVGTFEEDKDMEAVLAVWSRELPLEDIAKIVTFLDANDGNQSIVR